MSEQHTFTWEIILSKFQRKVHQATCSCGEVIECQTPNQNDAVSKWSKSMAYQHVANLANGDSIDAPMQLVGKVYKQRVTNEIWIVSTNGEYPAEVGDRLGFLRTNGQSEYSTYPWTILIKNSHGWKDRWSHWQYREQAYGAAQAWLEDQRVMGHEVEIASQVDLNTIEVPLAAVEQYLTRLVENAKEMDKPKDLVKLQAQIKEARSMLEMLEHAQALVEAKLVGLEIPDDPQYESYEYTPSG